MSFVCQIQRPEYVDFHVYCYNNIDGTHCPDNNCSLCNRFYILKQINNNIWYTDTSTLSIGTAIKQLYRYKNSSRLLVSPLGHADWLPIDIRIIGNNTFIVIQEERTVTPPYYHQTQLKFQDEHDHPMWDTIKLEISLFIRYLTIRKKSSVDLFT